ATNDGNVTLSNVFVEDTGTPSLESFTCSPSNPATLAPTKSIECTCTHTITQADLDAGKISDTACVSSTTSGTNEPCASAEEKANQKPHLTITKEATPTTYSKVGDVITYKIVATNDGNVTLSKVTVKDDPALDGFSCVPPNESSLAPSKSMTCEGTHTITEADFNAGKVSDTAGVSSTTTGTNEPCASAEVSGPPNLTITKTADTGGTPSTVAPAGEPIGFTITVASTGKITATTVSMHD